MVSKRISQSDHNVLIITYFDTVDENWINIEINLTDVKCDDEKLFRKDLDSALQSIIVEIEKQKIRLIIKDELRRDHK